MTTTIDLMRHGTPQGGNKYRGNSIDDPLSDEGWQQMWTAVDAYEPWEVIVSSPLQRCKAFAQAYSQKHPHIPLYVEDRIKEIGFGNWEGSSSREITEREPDTIKNFYHDPVNFRPEGAENLDLFQQRVSSAIQDILFTHKDRKILVIAHAGVMRAAITAIMGVESAAMYRISIGNAAIIRIRDDGLRPATLILE